jgi:hypothetical protein
LKSIEEIMEILEAYDLTGSLRGAAALAGCDHKTVAHYVELRDAGRAPDERAQRPMLIDEFLDKVAVWIDRSAGKIRADVVHEKLVAMGFTGSERTTRRAVAAVREAWRSGHRRVFRPWVPEPGCGCSSTRATDRRSPVAARCCSARGWPGHGSAWLCRRGIARCQHCWVAWMRRCAASTARRRMRSPTTRRQ